MVPSDPRSLLRSRPRPFAVAAALALHALVLSSMLQLSAWRDREPAAPAQTPVLVRLQWPAPQPTPALAASPSISRPTTRPRVAVPLGAPLAAPPQTIHDQPRPLVPPQTEAAAAPAPPPALKLELPRSASAPWRQRNLALDNPRANGAPATLESRLADAMGGALSGVGGWVQERLDNDRVRLRRGSECVEMQRSRAGQLDLGGGAFRDSWAVKKC